MRSRAAADSHRDPGGVRTRGGHRQRGAAFRVARIFSFVLVGLILLTVIALIVLRNYFDDRRIAKLVPELLEKQLRGGFRIGGLRIHLPGTVELEDLLVRDPYGDVVISAKYV